MPAKVRARLSYANVAATLALFVALGGVGYSATGGALILGHRNVAGNPSSLRADVRGKALKLTNKSQKTGASALGLLVAKGHAPFTTNSGTKVNRLNADSLDGLSKEAFVLAQDGRAFAYGQVREDGSLRPHSDTVVETTPGFVGHPSTGLYCITFTRAPSQAELEGSAITLSGTTAQALFPHITNGQGGDCGQGQLAIRFYNSTGTLTDARFMFMVP